MALWVWRLILQRPVTDAPAQSTIQQQNTSVIDVALKLVPLRRDIANTEIFLNVDLISGFV